MSNDRADIRDSHLDLEDLIADAAGQPASDGARAHLAQCEQCQAEARRWALVADGVRSLADLAPGSGPAAPAGRHPRGVTRIPAAWRRTMLVAGSAAAAVVLVIGVGAMLGIVHVRLSGQGTGTALTAVTGCDQLRQADGTLRRVAGSTLMVESGGATVAVTTTAGTRLSVSGPLLSDITNGASVMVRGYRSDDAIQASIITVGQPFSAVRPPGFAPVQGTVANAGRTGFTLVTSSGARLAVTTSDSTLVIVPRASLGQLRAGMPIFAIGLPGRDGTLAARGVAAVTQLASGPQTHVSMSVRDCSPRSIADALTAISTTRGPAG